MLEERLWGWPAPPACKIGSHSTGPAQSNRAGPHAPQTPPVILQRPVAQAVQRVELVQDEHPVGHGVQVFPFAYVPSGQLPIVFRDAKLGRDVRQHCLLISSPCHASNQQSRMWVGVTRSGKGLTCGARQGEGGSTRRACRVEAARACGTAAQE